MSCKKSLILILMLMPLSNVWSQGSTETRNFLKTFPVRRESSLEVNNKYGTIEITSWDKDSAFIRAEIKATAPNQAKLNKMFDGINVRLTEAGNLIVAQTIFTQNINAIFENFKGITSKVISYDSRIEINYYITIPEYMNLRIENRYGDVYMENNTGDFNLNLSNGSVKADSLGRKCHLTLAFCDAVITSIKAGSLDASFSEITISDVRKLSVKSISSKYRIGKLSDISFVSRRDNIIVEQAESIAGNLYFTDFEIGSLSRSVDLISRYGNLNIENIMPQFESVVINSGYSDIYLELGQDASSNIEIRTLNTFLSLPSKNAKTEKRTLDENKKEYITTGTVGNNPGNSNLKIDANRGKVFVK